MKKKRKLSKISAFHYFKLVFHALLFVVVLVLYVINRVHGLGDIFEMFDYTQIMLFVIWVVFLVEMIFRFFPAKIESMGCQKIFNRNHIPVDGQINEKPIVSSAKSTALIAVSWVLLNVVFGVLYYLNIFDDGILILISLAYSVCDMICILFFCPFQTWFMKNKCCNTCRIYNWDYAMIVTPLVFIPSFFTWCLVWISLLLLIKWEVFYKMHPERFSPNTNQNLQCENCKEKLCHHKKQLQGFLRNCKAVCDERLSKLQAKLRKDSKTNENEKTTE